MLALCTTAGLAPARPGRIEAASNGRTSAGAAAAHSREPRSGSEVVPASGDCAACDACHDGLPRGWWRQRVLVCIEQCGHGLQSMPGIATALFGPRHARRRERCICSAPPGAAGRSLPGAEAPLPSIHLQRRPLEAATRCRARGAPAPALTPMGLATHLPSASLRGPAGGAGAPRVSPCSRLSLALLLH